MKKELSDKTCILIVNPPGELQIGLQALLTTHLDVDVLVVSEVAAALKVIDRHEPSLIILDQDISRNEIKKIVKIIKSRWTDLLCIVLVNDDHSRQGIIEEGADLVVIKGLKGTKLIDLIKGLLGT